jgi:hypothetical protein
MELDPLIKDLDFWSAINLQSEFDPSCEFLPEKMSQIILHSRPGGGVPRPRAVFSRKAFADIVMILLLDLCF